MRKLICLFGLMLLFGCVHISEQSDFKTYPSGNPIDTIDVSEPIIVTDSLSDFKNVVSAYPWKYLVIHCTASQVKNKPAPISVFTNYWRDKLGWGNTPGYLAIIRTNGNVAYLTKNNFDNVITPDEITYGVKGLNRYSIHIAIEGMVEYKNGQLVNKDTRTKKQREVLDMMVGAARKIKPDIQVVGHRDIQIYSNKSCPNFNVLEEYGKPSTADFFDDSLHLKLLERVKFLN